MPLAPSTRLGSYEIQSALGAGGMGEVYRARDTRLDRDVAIKILPKGSAYEIFVAPVPWTGSKYQLPLQTSVSASSAFWSPTGNELFVNSGLTGSYVTAIRTAPRFEFGQPREFPKNGRVEAGPFSRRNTDMMPNGRQVIGVVNPIVSNQPLNRNIVVVLNWLEELKQRVPVK